MLKYIKIYIEVVWAGCLLWRARKDGVENIIFPMGFVENYEICTMMVFKQIFYTGDNYVFKLECDKSIYD